MSWRVSSLLCLLFVGACSLIEAPQSFAGTRYVLRSIQGAALPAPYSAGQLPTAVTTSDTLELRDDGTGTLSATTLEPGTAKVSHQSTELTFARSGSAISIELQCHFSAAQCIRPPHLIGVVSDTGIVFTQSAVSFAPLAFDRIR